MIQRSCSWEAVVEFHCIFNYTIWLVTEIMNIVFKVYGTCPLVYKHQLYLQRFFKLLKDMFTLTRFVASNGMSITIDNDVPIRLGDILFNCKSIFFAKKGKYANK